MLVASALAFMTKGAEPVKADPTKATLVIVRPSKLAYAIKPAILDETGRILGESRAMGWFTATIDPGQHTLYSWGEGTPTMKIEVEAGEIYYIEASMVMGMWAGRTRLIGLGEGRENWADLPGWMRKMKGWSVDADGAAEFARVRKADIDVVIAKGEAAWATYDEDARKRRSLGPDDGFTAPIQ